MPSRSVPIRDDKGRVIGMACYREKRARCQTHGCTGDANLLCDFPVKRRGKATTCNRHVCRKCARAIGPEQDYCPPHARLWDAGAGERADAEALRKILAEFVPCSAREED